jgi:hypothetical protein
MQPISDIPDDDFMKLQSLYEAELPICPICTLESVRHAVSDVVFGAPKSELSDSLRHMMEEVLFLVTGALVSERTDAEQDDETEH